MIFLSKHGVNECICYLYANLVHSFTKWKPTIGLLFKFNRYIQYFVVLYSLLQNMVFHSDQVD
jgi:hypothetical protein